MDNITFPSQGSLSSNQTFDSQSGARNSNAPPEFVNQGTFFSDSGLWIHGSSVMVYLLVLYDDYI